MFFSAPVYLCLSGALLKERSGEERSKKMKTPELRNSSGTPPVEDTARHNAPGTAQGAWDGPSTRACVDAPVHITRFYGCTMHIRH